MRWFTLLSVMMLGLPLAGQVTPAIPSTGPSPSPTGPKSALSKPVMEDYVRHLFVWGPQIQVKVADPAPSKVQGFQSVAVTASAGQASQEESFLVSNDGQTIIRGTVFNAAENPFAADAARIKTDGQPSFGPANAPVTIVVFSDFQCSFCRQEAKVIRTELPKEFPSDVRVFFKDYPLESIHPWAKSAAVAGQCIQKSNASAFWLYHDWIFENQEAITAESLKSKVLEWAKGKELEPIQLGSCLETKGTEALVNASIAEARTLGINSTPTLYVNGRKMVGNLPWPQIKQIIEHEIAYAKSHPRTAQSAANAADPNKDKCCEVSVPSPVNP